MISSIRFQQYNAPSSVPTNSFSIKKKDIWATLKEKVEALWLKFVELVKLYLLCIEPQKIEEKRRAADEIKNFVNVYADTNVPIEDVVKKFFTLSKPVQEGVKKYIKEGLKAKDKETTEKAVEEIIRNPVDPDDIFQTAIQQCRSDLASGERI